MEGGRKGGVNKSQWSRTRAGELEPVKTGEDQMLSIVSIHPLACVGNAHPHGGKANELIIMILLLLY